MLIACVQLVSDHAERLLGRDEQALHVVLVLTAEAHILALSKREMGYSALS